jgi:thiol-disulfide isomerase/thioredoxin
MAMRFIAISLAALGMLAQAQEFKLGGKVTDFAVADLDGKSLGFAALRGPVTVVTFVSTTCPVSNAYNDRMSAVYRNYAAKGVKFVFVNANRNESAANVREHAQSVGFPFSVYKDPENRLADRFDAQVTPESFVIDSDNVIRYHGQIDDSRNESRVHTQALRMALDAVLAGQAPPVAETKAFGCTIKRQRNST